MRAGREKLLRPRGLLAPRPRRPSPPHPPRARPAPSIGARERASGVWKSSLPLPRPPPRPPEGGARSGRRPSATVAGIRSGPGTASRRRLGDFPLHSPLTHSPSLSLTHRGNNTGSADAAQPMGLRRGSARKGEEREAAVAARQDGKEARARAHSLRRRRRGRRRLCLPPRVALMRQEQSVPRLGMGWLTGTNHSSTSLCAPASNSVGQKERGVSKRRTHSPSFL